MLWSIEGNEETSNHRDQVRTFTLPPSLKLLKTLSRGHYVTPEPYLHFSRQTQKKKLVWT